MQMLRMQLTLAGFHVGDRSSKSFENFCENISHIDARFYATDQYSVYNMSVKNTLILLNE